MPARPLALPMLLLLLLVPHALAGDRDYRDQDVRSPDGSLRFTAVSSDNRGGQRLTLFADDFVFTLTESETGDVLWTRKQARDEPSPERVWLHDDGWVVVKTGAEVLFLHAANGSVHHAFDILNALPPSERSAIPRSFGGIHWGIRSDFRLEEIDGSVYFVVRTDSGYRLVTEVTQGVPVDDRAVLSTLRARETDRALAVLERAASGTSLERAGANAPEVHRVCRAAQIAAQNGCTDAIPHLLELEQIEGAWAPTQTTTIDDPLIELGAVRFLGFRLHTVRGGMQIALRTLGATPRAGPASYLVAEGQGGSLRVLDPTLPEPRDGRVHLVTRGASMLDVLAAIGPPDEPGPNHHLYDFWRWHMDADGHSTLILGFADGIVEEIETLSPPVRATIPGATVP